VTALAAGVATVGIAVAAALAFSPDDGGPAPAALTSPPSPTAGPIASTAARTPATDHLVDPCLIGSWQQTAWDEPDVSFWGTEVDLRLRGKGWVTHYSADGVIWHDLRKGVTTRGRSGSRTYDSVYTGLMRWNIRADDGTDIYRNGTAKGQRVIKVNGRTEEKGGLTVERGNGSETYICSPTQLTVSDGNVTKEYRRISDTPSPYPT
jgi:hypothetical protein